MTDIQISQLVQDVINGKEDPRKANKILHNIRNLHHTPHFIDNCMEEVSELIEHETIVYPEYISQWVKAEDGFNCSVNGIDNRRRDYRNSIDHY